MMTRAIQNRVKNPTKVMVVASRVKVRYARDIIDGVEETVSSTNLLPGDGYRMRRRGSIFGDRG